MKNQLILLLLTLLCFAANAQRRVLTIKFEPSYFSSSILTITESAQKSTIRLQILENDGSVLKQEEETVSKEELKSLSDFFSNYQFKIKGSIDTLGMLETVRNGKKVTAYRISIGNDGMMVKGNLQNDSTFKNFSFWSPKAGTENHSLITKLFILMDSNLKASHTKRYLEGLKENF